MQKTNCARCGQPIDASSRVKLEKMQYCFQCAHQVKESLREKKADVDKETQQIMHVRDIIEEELQIVSEEDARHIVVTTTNNIEGMNIGEYIDVISVEDIQVQNIQFDPEQDGDVGEQMGDIFRRRMKLGLFKLKKRAYLSGADAVVGVRIDSAVNTLMHKGKLAIGMTKVNISGTAVRLMA